MKQALIIDLVAFNVNVQLAHWRANTVTNEHRTLGDLYDATSELTDTLAELIFGKAGSVDLPPRKIEALGKVAPAELLKTGLQTVASLRAELKAGADDDALNVLADISAAINRAKYLLAV